MNAQVRRCVGLVLMLLLLVSTVREARADELEHKAAEAGVAIGIAGAAIAVGIVLLVTHKPSLTGCVAQGPHGLTISNEADAKTYTLKGDLDGIAAGQRVKVRGKHHKHNASQFDVLELKKTYGACAAHP